MSPRRPSRLGDVRVSVRNVKRTCSAEASMAARACKRCGAGACESSVRSEGARGRRWHLKSMQQATTRCAGQLVSGRHHMLVPFESRLKRCQHRDPKVRMIGSRGCRQAKCVSKLQRQQAHVCLEVKEPTSWLELSPSLGSAGSRDAAPVQLRSACFCRLVRPSAAAAPAREDEAPLRRLSRMSGQAAAAKVQTGIAKSKGKERKRHDPSNN